MFRFIFLLLIGTILADFDDSHFNLTRITARFSRHSLEKFLESEPDLWESTPISNANLDHYRSLLGAAKAPEDDLKVVAKYSRYNGRHRQFNTRKLPRSFDAREKWPNCKSIGIIQDQSRCADCWAVAAASVMSDRVCIASGGQRQPQISASDLLACCTECYSDKFNGCNGGYPFRAWTHFVNDGIVSGGTYKNGTGCLPYVYPPCNIDAETQSIDSSCPVNNYQSGQCYRKCQSQYPRFYYNDKYYGSQVLYPQTVDEIMQELYTNGPIEMKMDIYEDFVAYRGGIYYNRYGKNLGAHSVRLIGWGETNGLPYWLMANSWNTGWGENGFFKIVRGTNHVTIEREAVTGLVDLRRSAY